MSTNAELAADMEAVETQQGKVELSPARYRVAVAGLGSNLLALGAPGSLGLIDCGSVAGPMQDCHRLLFGALELRTAGDNHLPAADKQREFTTEEAFACDIVCLCTTQEFRAEWIAEATHLNIIDTGPWSQGMQSVALRAHVSWLGKPRHPVQIAHGSLHDVITGSVSGRVGEEITALLWTPTQHS